MDAPQTSRRSVLLARFGRASTIAPYETLLVGLEPGELRGHWAFVPAILHLLARMITLHGNITVHRDRSASKTLCLLHPDLPAIAVAAPTKKASDLGAKG